jgi:GT2 family glycosyltransferase
MGETRLNIVVGIPTVGRSTVLCETLRELGRQTLRPDRIIVCGTNSADVEGVSATTPDALVLLTKAGLPRQRNAVIDAAECADVVVFIDDDFLPHPGYLAEIARHMAENPSIVVATGAVLADGIGGPGYSPDTGRAILRQTKLPKPTVARTFSGYGCNMAVRLAPMRLHNLKFDERLPLYAWQEDVDLSRRISAYGEVVRISSACGVHLGVKAGRGSGVRLGYSQIANPLYICRKRCGYPMRRAMEHIARNMLMNIMRSTWPEPYVDRRGRLRGNLLAIQDLLTGHMRPERILDI